MRRAHEMDEGCSSPSGPHFHIRDNMVTEDVIEWYARRWASWKTSDICAMKVSESRRFTASMIVLELGAVL